MQKYILAGDIGGTKTSLAIFTGSAKEIKIHRRQTYRSADYPSLTAIITDFLRDVDTDFVAACFGVAGPVIDGKAQITNLPWLLDAKALAREFDLNSCDLINDLAATALGLQALTADDIHTLNQGKAWKEATIGVIAPGTGLGEAFLVWEKSGYTAKASEGGHCDFAPADKIQAGLGEYLQDKYGHVSYERVCSGMGLPDIYNYLTKDSAQSSPAGQEIIAAKDPTPIIVKFGLQLENTCPICRQSLAIFISVLGAKAGNLALQVMATGGVYLGGGIPPRILNALESGPFMAAFTNKGRMAEMLRQVPVHVIINPDAALMGAAINALNGSINEK